MNMNSYPRLTCFKYEIALNCVSPILIENPLDTTQTLTYTIRKNISCITSTNNLTPNLRHPKTPEILTP